MLLSEKGDWPKHKAVLRSGFFVRLKNLPGGFLSFGGGTLRCALAAILVFAITCPAFSSSPVDPGAQYDVAFSPRGGSLELVIGAINGARKSIRVAAYSFTSSPVAQALLSAHRRGVDVRVVADTKANGTKYTAVTYLANQGVPVRLNSRYTIHHHKFMVLDGESLQTGSFNYSAAAVKRNAENVLVLYGVPYLAAKYSAEWGRLWDEATPLAKRY